MLKAATTRRTQPAPGPMASLDAEADTMRAQLSHLRRELADARRELGERVLAGQHDALTGTPNRSLMADRIERAIAVARRRGTRIAVCFIDGRAGRLNYIWGIWRIRAQLRRGLPAADGDGPTRPFQLVHAHYVLSGLAALLSLIHI